MRMRKKKNLEGRLLEVSDILFISDIEDRNFATAKEKKEYLDLDEWFGRSAPLYLEIGCGKGKFSCEAAKQNPDINFLAVEKSGNVIVEACETAKREEISNLRFIKCGAEYLEKYLRDNSVDRIFLNFSCPFPKAAYASHRLTHKNFLEIYKRILKQGAEIHQKTDNMHFFEFSLEQFSCSGFALKNISLDLHASDFEGNIMTEYETKFVSHGFPIYRLEAYLAEEKDD
ncbi:MAG: tRNA (guanosine(46)-N7)-methyltransferase TrmB [Ruminococcaceae bacterium]|nr:tRNA (guanosine(46)-N7)-methyltransferase TrmB [Oscillospiraceae bacterium]